MHFELTGLIIEQGGANGLRPTKRGPPYIYGNLLDVRILVSHMGSGDKRTNVRELIKVITSMRVNITSHIRSYYYNKKGHLRSGDLEYPNEEKILVCRRCIFLPEDAQGRLLAVVMALQKYEH